MPSVRSVCQVLCLWGVVGLAQAATSTTHWVCEVVYAPERKVWSREVHLQHDDRQLLQVAIDGVPVYRFVVLDTRIFTSQDNERIRLDVEARTWSSDFRGLAQGQGRCEVAG